MQNNKNTYVTILRDSLVKKLQLMEQIVEQNKIQEQLGKSEKFDYDVFGETLRVKEKLIEEIQSLDSGFQTVYNRVRELLEQDRETYREDILELKELVAKVTEKSMDIMAQEQRNRDTVMNRTDSLKKEIGMKRTTNKVAANYYKTMSKLNAVDSQFFDTKK